MEPLELARYLAALARDKKGFDLLVLDVEALVGYTSYFVLCSARSERQVQAIADHLVRTARTDRRVRPLGTEGLGGRARWALLDYGDVVVHVFHEEERDFYDLEGLWQDAPRVSLPAAEPAAKAAT
ncbi:MAG: ribosome silencing factor [Myxococcales bacterium]|nr:ribosome silencing factor [Myxococcales bacterium]